MSIRASLIVLLGALIALVLCTARPALAQFNSDACTVSVLNRSVRVNPDGSWVLPNIPANFGLVRARVTCIVDGQTVSGESEPFLVPANGVVNLPHITFGQTTPIPTSLTVTATPTTLTQAGSTAELGVSAHYSDGTTKDVTAASTGTQYTISNPAIATISGDGVVTAVQSGTVLIQATQEGASGIASVRVVLGGQSHGGIPDSWLLSYGLSPNDPTIADQDPDRDGLTNLQEFQLGTNPIVADTDGDGLSDGDEIARGISPLLTDTDADLIPDGVEVRTGTDPLNRNSYDLRAARATSVLRPQSFRLSTSPLALSASQQLSWRVNLIDGKTTLDLTNDPRTNYSSSDLTICNFGSQKGLIFAGNAGSCVITISQNTLSVTVPATIQSFTPTERSSIGISGAVAVDTAGTFAYVAAGANGLVVVDVTDATTPRLRGSLAGLGNAVAVRAFGQRALVGDANGFLRIVDVSNPDLPMLLASLAIAGRPNAIALHGTTVAMAAQAGGVSFVDIADVTVPTVTSTVGVPGTALGVDFDVQQGIAAVAMGTAGLQLVDISSLNAPQLRGLLPGGDVRRVLMKYPAVLLADVQRSVTAVNITNANQPTITSSIAPNSGGAPVDIAAFGTVAMTADISFGRAIPVITLANPLQPSTVLFWTLGSAGFSSSIAVDPRYGYLVMPNQLRIFQYQDVIDASGIPPAVQITSPVNGTQVIYGSTVNVKATATDDVAVAQVNFLVNGQPALLTTVAPYEYALTIPNNASALTLGATATDFGNNTGTATDVVLNLIPDPLTRAVGRVSYNGQPVSGATVTCRGNTGLTASDGSFIIAGIPTLMPVQCIARPLVIEAITLSGSSGSVTAVRGGTTSVGSIALGPIPIVTSLSRRSALLNAVVNLSVTGNNFAGATFSFNTAAIKITTASIDASGHAADLGLAIGGSGAGTYALAVTNVFGSSASAVTAFNRFTVVDPAASIDSDHDGLPDVIEAIFGSDPLDPASVPNTTATSSGEIEAIAFSVVNNDNGPSQTGTRETNALPFSVVNAGRNPAQTTSLEADALPFSTLNLAALSGGVPVAMEASAVPVSVLNSDPSAPVRAGDGSTGGSGGGTGGGGSGTLVFHEGDAISFSVNNLASSAPPGAIQARSVNPGNPDVTADVALLPSRPMTDVQIAVLSTACSLVHEHQAFMTVRRDR